MPRKPQSKKRKRDDAAPEVETAIRRPGLESGHVHIATMFMAEGKEDLAQSLTHGLFPHLQKRVCTRPKRKPKEAVK